MAKLDVIYEDNHLLVLNKPAGIATQGAEAGEISLLSVGKQYVKRKYQKPGNVYLGTVSRLDAVVSGVVVFARTSKAAARLSEQFRSQTVKKLYWAVVSGEPAENEPCFDWLAKDEPRQRMRVVEAGTAGARLARLTYRRLRRLRGGWLLEIEPQTGRKHQIRVQLAERRLPIAGDCKYGSRETFSQGIALHARMLQLVHPTRDEAMIWEAGLPAAWRALGAET